MAKSEKKAAVESTVSDEFAGVVSRQDGRIVVDLSSLLYPVSTSWTDDVPLLR